MRITIDARTFTVRIMGNIALISEVRTVPDGDGVTDEVLNEVVFDDEFFPPDIAGLGEVMFACLNNRELRHAVVTRTQVAVHTSAATPIFTDD